jgi:hypothetical protein
MRDDNDYSSMGRQELRRELQRVSKEITVWTEVAANARRDENLYFLDAVSSSLAKAITERKLEGDLHAGEFTREALEAEGRAAAFTVIRDLIVVLLRTTEVD